MRGLAGWRRKYWMMIRWYWWIINVGECKCPLVHKYQYWYYDLIISTGISMLDHVIFRYIQKCPSQLDISSPASPSSGLIIAGGNRAAGKKKIPNWKIVFLVGSGNRFLMISDDFWWFRMTSDDFGWFLHQTLARMQISGFNSLAKASVKGPMASENFSDTCGQVVMASQNDFLICEQPIVDQTGLKD